MTYVRVPRQPADYRVGDVVVTVVPTTYTSGGRTAVALSVGQVGIVRSSWSTGINVRFEPASQPELSFGPDYRPIEAVRLAAVIAPKSPRMTVTDFAVGDTVRTNADTEYMGRTIPADEILEVINVIVSSRPGRSRVVCRAPDGDVVFNAIGPDCLRPVDTLELVTPVELAGTSPLPPQTPTCRWCDRSITFQDGKWLDDDVLPSLCVGEDVPKVDGGYPHEPEDELPDPRLMRLYPRPLTIPDEGDRVTTVIETTYADITVPAGLTGTITSKVNDGGGSHVLVVLDDEGSFDFWPDGSTDFEGEAYRPLSALEVVPNDGMLDSSVTDVLDNLDAAYEAVDGMGVAAAAATKAITSSMPTIKLPDDMTEEDLDEIRSKYSGDHVSLTTRLGQEIDQLRDLVWTMSQEMPAMTKHILDGGHVSVSNEQIELLAGIISARTHPTVVL